MDESKGGGFPWGPVLVVAFVLAVAIGCGAPVINGGGLSWDNSGWINAQNARTERERIQQAQETARVREREETARVMSDNMMMTLQWMVVVGGVVGVIAVAGWATSRSVEAWAARPHRPAAAPPAVIVMQASPELAAAPEARLEYSEEDGAWVIVNDKTKTVKLLEDWGSAPRRLS